MKSAIASLLGAVLIFGLAACGGGSAPSNDRLEQAFAEGRSGVWLSGHGIVVRELGASPTEQRIQVRINDDLTLVLHRDTAEAASISVQPDDRLAFHGRYEFHGGGGTVSMTHSDPAQPGGGGWIEVNGRRQD